MADTEISQSAEEEKKPFIILGLSAPVFFLALFNIIIVLGGVSYIFYTQIIYQQEPSKEMDAAKDLERKVDMGALVEDTVHIVTLPEMNVNLKGRRGSKRFHYANLEVSLRCNNKRCLEEVEAIQVKIEDLIHSVIASKSYLELTNSEPSALIRHSITKGINKLLKTGTVMETYFSNYTVQ